MEKSMVVMVLMLAVLPYQLQSYDTSYSWLSIDCGATNTWEDPLTSNWWTLDDEFIKTGQNILLPVTTNRLPLETLRYFPEGTKNCYNLPLYLQTKYIIRAGFYYGNYDNLLEPPTFNLQLDGNLWATVTTSLGNDPIYHEVIYVPRKKYVSVCLNQTQQGHIPFISSLEVMLIYNSVYRLMNNETALYLERRTNYGADQTVPERFNTLAEDFNRFWKPEQLPNYQNIFNGIDIDFGSMAENYPPYKVLNDAIRAQNVSDSIFLPIDFHETTQLSAYFVFYFYDLSPWPYLNNITKLTVYIDGIEKNTTTVRPNEECVVVSIYPVKVTGTANVTISPAAGTTLPPILNAMEVFTTIEVATSMADPMLSFCAFFYILVYLFGVVVWFG